jgi:hypothetical protein
MRTAVNGEAEWRLSAVAHGGVLAGEGAGGDVDELQELLGGESEMRAALIEEKGVADGGLTLKQRRRWRSDGNRRGEGASVTEPA